MKLLVVSDVHGDYDALEQAYRAEKNVGAVIFLGDGVPVYREKIEEQVKVPFVFAPASCNRQRAAAVAALGAVYFREGKIVSAKEHRPEYLRKSQAEREREEKGGLA